MTGLVLVVGSLLAQAHPAEVPYEEAVEALGGGDAARAEAKAREALAASLRFAPEEEIEARPEKGLLFDEMILEARKSYRARRARYFRVLGDALQAQQKWGAARKNYRRAMALADDPSLPLLMARHEDLGIRERLELLLEAYLSTAPSDRSRLESEILATGAFRTRNALKASLDRSRFEKLRARYPDLELLDSPFPDFQSATNTGTLIPSRLLDAGATLVLYSPSGIACERCSEELDGITRPVRAAQKPKRPVEVAAFVPERELEIARRIVRLLGMTVGVGRSEGLPPSLGLAEGGEIRVVARGGLTQIRIPMSAEITTPEIQERASAIFAFLDEPGLPTEAEPEDASRPLVTLERGSSDKKTFLEWIARLEKLEAGPAPLADLYSELGRITQRVLSDEADGGRQTGLELVAAFSRLRGANVAKTRALSVLGERIGEKLLEKAQSHDASVRRTPSGETGRLEVALAKDGRLYIQRSFESGEDVVQFDFALADDGAGLQPVWAAPSEGAPLGVEAVEAGGVFHFTCAARESCRGVKLVDGAGLRPPSFGQARPSSAKAAGVLFVAAPGAVIGGKPVSIRSALVDPILAPESSPHFYRSYDAEGETALERGLRLFEHLDFAGAAKAFEEAAGEIDEIAPYDASDLLYNRGRALQEQGKRREALAIFRSLGDVSYQHRVDERARLIESGR